MLFQYSTVKNKIKYNFLEGNNTIKRHDQKKSSTIYHTSINESINLNIKHE